MNPSLRRQLFNLAIFCLLILSVVPLSPNQPGKIRIDVDGVLSSTGGHAGTSINGLLQVQLEKGYHVNSDVPLDNFLIPTVLTLEPPQGITVDSIVYPEAVLLTQTGADSPLAVFEETFVIGVTLNLSDDLKLGEHIIPARLRYQACDETMCYLPSSIGTTFTVKVVPHDKELTPLHTELFSSITFTQDVSTVRSDNDDTVQSNETLHSERDALTLLNDFTILGTTGGYLGSNEFLNFVETAESGDVQKGLLEGRGPLAIFFLVLLGGLALNLTPCVLPMIPINLAIIGAGTKAGSRLKGFLLGGTYGLAMALVYGVLGIVVILTTGTFGAINASPWFNFVIAAVFIVLSLAMFDVITIDFSHLQSRIHITENQKGTYFIAFGMGTIAALLAGACVAPVVIQVVLFSSNLYATGTIVALALPLVLGLGMALPWPVAGAGLSFMPKPGPWMVHVKHALGVFILATAAYYGYLSYTIFADRWVDATEVTNSVDELVKEGWYPSLSGGLQAAKDENKPVLVDVWATWCKNCLTMDKTTLKDPDVQTRLSNYVKIKFQAEDPSASPAKEVLGRFKAIGLPAYAILEPISTRTATFRPLQP